MSRKSGGRGRYMKEDVQVTGARQSGGGGRPMFNLAQRVVQGEYGIWQSYTTPLGDKVLGEKYTGTSTMLRSRVLGMMCFFSQAYPSGVSSDANATDAMHGVESRVWFDNLYYALIAKVQQSGRFITFPALTNPHSLNDWVGAYIQAYCGLRALHGAVAGAGFNRAGEMMSQRAIDNRSLIESLSDRLATVPMPAGLNKALDTCCGAFADAKDGTLYIVGASALTTHQNVDLTNPTDVANLIGQIQANIDVLFKGNALVTQAEAVSFLTIFGNLYGPQAPWDVAEIRINHPHMDSLLTMMVAGTWAAGADYSMIPFTFQTTSSITSTSRPIPILARRGVEDPLRFSFWRPQVDTFWTNTIAGSVYSEQHGLLTQFNAGLHIPTEVTTINAEGDVTHVSIADTGTGFQHAHPMWDYWWAALMEDEIIVTDPIDILDHDARSYREYDVVWMTPDQLAVNHIALLHKLFLENGQIV